MKFFKRVAKQVLRSNRFEYFCFLVYLASEGWVGALVKKAFSECRKIQANKVSCNKSLQHQSLRSLDGF